MYDSMYYSVCKRFLHRSVETPVVLRPSKVIIRVVRSNQGQHQSPSAMKVLGPLGRLADPGPSQTHTWFFRIADVTTPQFGHYDKYVGLEQEAKNSVPPGRTAATIQVPFFMTKKVTVRLPPWLLSPSYAFCQGWVFHFWRAWCRLLRQDLCCSFLAPNTSTAQLARINKTWKGWRSWYQTHLKASWFSS